MLLYRYRPFSELSMKELIYDEIFFASTSECNDPYEGKAFAKLDGNRDAWDRLIRAAIASHPAAKFDYLVRNIVDYFTAKSPLFIDELLDTTADEIAKIGNDKIEMAIYPKMLEHIKQYVKLYIPTERYFVSFSKQNNKMLMWSHYAGNHRGYCLVFRIADRKLHQSPFWKRTNISHDTPNGVASHTSFQIEDSFLMKDIEYVSEPQYMDGFLCFPRNVVGYDPAPDVLDKHMRDFNNVYLQKHSVWEDEKEVRILLSSGTSWFAGERLSLSPHQRLFHYDSTQLVGIIFGAKMPNDQRKRIKEIISEKVARWYSNRTDEMTISDFVFFEERLSESNRDVCIEPIEMLSVSTYIKKDAPEFDRLYQKWKDGWAIRIVGTGSSMIQII